jgi:hypothetical protein
MDPLKSSSASESRIAANLHLPSGAALMRAAPDGQLCSANVDSRTYIAGELARDLHYSQSETSEHVGTDNIKSWHCPHCW